MPVCLKYFFLGYFQITCNCLILDVSKSNDRKEAWSINDRSKQFGYTHITLGLWYTLLSSAFLPLYLTSSAYSNKEIQHADEVFEAYHHFVFVNDNTHIQIDDNFFLFI